jgi:hypothetical protein
MQLDRAVPRHLHLKSCAQRHTPERRRIFTELMPLLRKRRLLLTISFIEGDTIRATVVPQAASDTDDNALTTPLAITGTEPSPASKKAP